MLELMLFVDGSVDTRSHIGYGAYLAVSECGLPDDLMTQVKVRRFAQTSSTKLELQTLLWALGEIQAPGRKLVVYTDSQNIIGLPARRERLELRDFRANNHTRLNNYELYQEFYQRLDQQALQLVKVPGHQATQQKDDIGRLFTLVDRAARNALREETRP